MPFPGSDMAIPARILLIASATLTGCGGRTELEPPAIAEGRPKPELGCSDTGVPVGCPIGFLGDDTAPIEMELVTLTPDGAVVPLNDGDPIAMVSPPSAGLIVFAGVRATNLDPCKVRLRGTLRGEQTAHGRLDERIVNLEPTCDGWASSSSDPAWLSSIPVCPNQWSSTDINDHLYELTVRVTDAQGRTASKSIQVIPKCAEPRL